MPQPGPTPKSQQALFDWYKENARTLPWRQTRDPYKIWLSEVMLQQTTVTAVIPYYQRFLTRFPTLKKLAEAPIEHVLEFWSGLGYYSRARNLHKAAQILAAAPHFPRTHVELLEVPGFGPYTARSVASLAFDENVGVVDGNVIRVLSRLHGLEIPWWKTKDREVIQGYADRWVQNFASSTMNQALMELGATLCTPENPKCLLCPVRTFCDAHRENTIERLPLKKPRRETEIWIWTIYPLRQKDRVLLVPNTYAPFLKGHLIWPGDVRRGSKPPAKFNYQHAVTHHKIYVQIHDAAVSAATKKKWSDQPDAAWVKTADLPRRSPTTLVRKAWTFLK